MSSTGHLYRLLEAWRQAGGAEDEIQATANVLQLALEEKLPQAELPPEHALRQCNLVAVAVRRALDKMREP